MSWLGNIQQFDYSGLVEAIAYGNGEFVIGGTSSTYSRTAYSEDGLSWTEENCPIGGHIAAIAFGNGRFVAVNHSGGSVAWSTN